MMITRVTHSRYLKNTGVIGFLEAGSLGRRTPALFVGQQLEELGAVLDHPAADDIDAAGKKGIGKISGRRADDGNKCIRSAVGKDLIQGIV